MKQLLQADQLVTMLAEATGRKLTAEGLMAYDIALSDVPIAALNTATYRLLRSAKFMPSPAEIREAAGVATGAVAAKDKPTLAWCDVRRSISRVGGYDSPNFEDAIINATIREMGGWVLLCESTVEELVWREKDFLRMYAALSSCNLADDRTERLSGITEKENGLAIPAPVVDVGCLTTGGNGTTKRLQVIDEKRIVTHAEAVTSLSRRLVFDDREPPQTAVMPVVKSRDEQLAALRSMTERQA